LGGFIQKKSKKPTGLYEETCGQKHMKLSLYNASISPKDFSEGYYTILLPLQDSTFNILRVCYLITNSVIEM
jgi:hypothetical protein